MKKLIAVLFIFPSFCLAQTPPPSTAVGSSVAERRAYPGGRDDSDLTVQPVRRLTTQTQNVDDHYEPEAPQYNSTEGDGDVGE